VIVGRLSTLATAQPRREGVIELQGRWLKEKYR